MQNDIVLRHRYVFADLSVRRPHQPEGDPLILAVIQTLGLVAMSASHGGVQVVAVAALLIMGAMLLVQSERI